MLNRLGLALRSGRWLLAPIVLLAVACQPETDTRPAPTGAAPSPTSAQGDPEPGSAANADVVFVEASQAAGGLWTFDVTVSHPDAGWEDYANGWDVITPDGLVLKRDPSDPFTRLLLHPHVDEQPFTRSQSGIQIPDGVTQVTVRAHDLVAGFGGREVTVDLTAESGDSFKVERRQ